MLRALSGCVVRSLQIAAPSWLSAVLLLNGPLQPYQRICLLLYLVCYEYRYIHYPWLEFCWPTVFNLLLYMLYFYFHVFILLIPFSFSDFHLISLFKF